MGDTSWSEQSRGSQCTLFSAAAARKRAEQDSILLANRIRLLKAEEEKTRKKIRETETKTQEIVQLRRRNEERRLSKEAEEMRRESQVQDIRYRQMQERDEQQRRLQAKQRGLMEQKQDMSSALKKEREAHKIAIDEQRALDMALVQEKHSRVKESIQACARSRSRSECARQEMAKSAVQERVQREEQEAQAKLEDISRMEREEQMLMAKLQHTQERHRAAFMQLEDALRHDASNASCSRSRATTPEIAAPFQSTGTGSATSSRLPCASSVARSDSRTAGSRPPRPRGLPSAATPSSMPFAPPAATRPLSASRSLPGKRFPARSEHQTPKHSTTSLSSCSTASGADSGQGGAGSGHSTPCSQVAPQITYTTVDGLQLDIPAEEDLDLASFLNS